MFLFIAAVLLAIPSASAQELSRTYEELPLGTVRPDGCWKCFSVREMVSQPIWTRYLQQANQVSIIRGPHNSDIVYDGTASLMGVLCGYPCCLCNLHQGWPKFTQNLWYSTKDGGLAAMTYAPCHFTVNLQGVDVTVTEDTYKPGARHRITYSRYILQA